MGFSGLEKSTVGLAPKLTLATTINSFGIGFQRGSYNRWQPLRMMFPACPR